MTKNLKNAFFYTKSAVYADYAWFKRQKKNTRSDAHLFFYNKFKTAHYAVYKCFYLLLVSRKNREK